MAPMGSMTRPPAAFSTGHAGLFDTGGGTYHTGYGYGGFMEAAPMPAGITMAAAPGADTPRADSARPVTAVIRAQTERIDQRWLWPADHDVFDSAVGPMAKIMWRRGGRRGREACREMGHEPAGIRYGNVRRSEGVSPLQIHLLPLCHRIMYNAFMPRGNPNWQKGTSVRWRFCIRGRNPDGEMVTLGCYRTKGEATAQYVRLAEEGYYERLSIGPLSLRKE